MGKDLKVQTIANNLLCYISSARHKLSDHQIVENCLSYYPPEAIKRAKEIIFQAVKEKATWNKNKNKTRADLEDIIGLMRKCDARAYALPRFVADSYAAFPPTYGIETIRNNVSVMMSELVALKDQIKLLKEQKRLRGKPQDYESGLKNLSNI